MTDELTLGLWVGVTVLALAGAVYLATVLIPPYLFHEWADLLRRRVAARR